MASCAVAKIVFTQHLRRFTETPDVETNASTLRDALNDAFVINPRLRGYILDDQGHLRQHVVVFIDGVRSRDKTHLSDPIGNDSAVYVLQALSGG